MGSVGPELTVVVATRDRPAALERCLAGLARATLAPGRLEVVVVDDGGSAPLEEHVVRATPGLSVRLLRVDHGGPGRARNLGVEDARAAVVAFTDDDCVPHADWAELLLEEVRADPTLLVGGRTVNGLPDNPYATASQRVVDAVYSWSNADPRDGRFLASNNMAVSRRAFLAAGGFDESFTIASEDRELCDRWRWRGGRLALVPRAVVEHHHDLDLGRFVAQHVRYGRGAYRFHSVRRARGSGGLMDGLGFVLDPRNWPWGTGTRRPLPARARHVALVCLWQAANAWGFARGALGGRRSG